MEALPRMISQQDSAVGSTRGPADRAGTTFVQDKICPAVGLGAGPILDKMGPAVQ